MVAAQLVFLPWALGGTREWGQIISLVLAAIGFGVALTPRNYDEDTSGQVPFCLYTWPKLLRFPIFWLGLAFLGYIVVQALNPAWVYESGGESWMRQIKHITWLPAGVQVPFEQGGPWRMLVIYASVWLSVCAVWIGCTRRKSLQVLFSVLAANAFLLAGLGIAQRALGATKIFWFWQPQYAYFVSSFIYKNHAGAYFNLLLSLCAGLAYWHYDRSERRHDKSSPSGLFAFFGTAVAMIILFSYSRTATLLMFAFLLLTFAIFIWRGLVKTGLGNRNKLMLLIGVIALTAFVRIGLVSLPTERFIESMERLQGDMRESRSGARLPAAQATWDMARDRLLTGWGSGSFMFNFPAYQQHYPAIFMPDGRRMVWEHAHDDYLELLAELGIIGTGILLVGLGYAFVTMFKVSTWRNPLALVLCMGLLVTAIHSIVDYNFYNPAILTTWCVLMFAMIRWVELEEMNAPV